MNRKILKIAAQYLIPAIAQSGYIIVPLVELFKAKKTPLAHLSAKEEKSARQVLDASMSYMMTHDEPNTPYIHEENMFHPDASFLLLPMNHVKDGAMSATMMLEECFGGNLSECFAEACERIFAKTACRPEHGELDEAVAVDEDREVPYLPTIGTPLKLITPVAQTNNGWEPIDMPTSTDGGYIGCSDTSSDTSSSSCSDTSF